MQIAVYVLVEGNNFTVYYKTACCLRVSFFHLKSRSTILTALKRIRNASWKQAGFNFSRKQKEILVLPFVCEISVYSQKWGTTARYPGFTPRASCTPTFQYSASVSIEADELQYTACPKIKSKPLSRGVRGKRERWASTAFKPRSYLRKGRWQGGQRTRWFSISHSNYPEYYRINWILNYLCMLTSSQQNPKGK